MPDSLIADPMTEMCMEGIMLWHSQVVQGLQICLSLHPLQSDPEKQQYNINLRNQHK